MKLFAATALIAATLAGGAFAQNAPLSAVIAFEVQKIVPGADLSNLTVHQIASLNGLFANDEDRSGNNLNGQVKMILNNAQ